MDFGRVMHLVIEFVVHVSRELITSVLVLRVWNVELVCSLDS